MGIEIKVVLLGVGGLIALGLTISFSIKMFHTSRKNSSNAKNGVALTQTVEIKAEAGAHLNIATGGRDSFSASGSQYSNAGSGSQYNNPGSGEQYNHCVIEKPVGSTEKESSARAIKHAIRIFFSKILGNQNKEGKREGGLLDHRNMRTGQVKSEMLHATLNRFRECRRTLRVARHMHAAQFTEVDQASLRELFNRLVGEDEKEANTVTEGDLYAVTDTVERDFVDATNKILSKYLKP